MIESVHWNNMKCFVLLLAVSACARAATDAVAPCAVSQEFFARYNASADDNDGPGSVCGGQCCGRGREAALRSTLRRLAVRADATRSVAELLLSTQRTLRDHLTALSHQSQNKTGILMYQVYKGHAARAHAPLTALYEDIRTLLRSKSERDLAAEEVVLNPPPKDLTASTKQFFRDVFPIAYFSLLKLEGKKFKPEYDACLRDAYEAVQPFGEVPQQLGTKLSQAMAASRTLLHVLGVGAGALTSSGQVLATVDQQCSDKLLQAAACARCRGHDARPCRDYCLNVARGCIGSLVADLDAPWTNFVESVERLTGSDADKVLRALDERVSEGIMHAYENHGILEKKVRQECGPPSTEDTPVLPTPRPVHGSIRRDHMRVPPADAELLQFTASLSNKKKLFAKLADRLCDQPDFAGEGNQHCWNGETIGEYSKSLVQSASIVDQRYNPEVIGGAPPNPTVAAIADRLLQARQLLVESWGTAAPVAEAYMQGDEAGLEGSGSGRSYELEDDAAYDAEGSGEDGSGVPDDIRGRTAVITDTADSTTPKTKAAGASRPMLWVVLSVTLLASVRNHLT